MRFIILFVIFFCLPVQSVFGDAEEATYDKGIWIHKIKIINDPQSPVQITHAKLINYGKPDLSSKFKFPAFEISVTSNIQNVSSILYDIILYDSFRDYDSRYSLVYNNILQIMEGSWKFYEELSPSFDRFGTACLFVRKVRLRSGKIWVMNTKYIANEMMKLKCGTQNLREKENRLKNKGETKRNVF